MKNALCMYAGISAFVCAGMAVYLFQISRRDPKDEWEPEEEEMRGPERAVAILFVSSIMGISWAAWLPILLLEMFIDKKEK